MPQWLKSFGEMISGLFNTVYDYTLGAIFNHEEPETNLIAPPLPQIRQRAEKKVYVAKPEEPIHVTFRKNSYNPAIDLSGNSFTVDLSDYVNRNQDGSFTADKHVPSPIYQYGVKSANGFSDVRAPELDLVGPEYRYTKVTREKGVIVDVRDGYVADTSRLSQDAQSALKALAAANMNF